MYDILANEEPNYVNAAVCFHAIEDNDGYEVNFMLTFNE